MAEKQHPVHKLIWKHFHLRDKDQPIPWGSSMRYTRRLLGAVFCEAGYRVGAEIGVRRGEYSRVLLEQNPDLHLYCVDPWNAYDVRYPQERQDRIYEECLRNLAGYNFTVVRQTSMEAVRAFEPNSLDFVYIDGNHKFDFVMEDIIHWSRRVRPGGILACHDFHYGSNLEVVHAVLAYTSANHIDPWYVTKEVEPTAYWVKP